MLHSFAETDAGRFLTQTKFLQLQLREVARVAFAKSPSRNFIRTHELQLAAACPAGTADP